MIHLKHLKKDIYTIFLFSITFVKETNNRNSHKFSYCSRTIYIYIYNFKQKDPSMLMLCAILYYTIHWSIVSFVCYIIDKYIYIIYLESMSTRKQEGHQYYYSNRIDSRCRMWHHCSIAQKRRPGTLRIHLFRRSLDKILWHSNAKIYKIPVYTEKNYVCRTSTNKILVECHTVRIFLRSTQCLLKNKQDLIGECGVYRTIVHVLVERTVWWH